MTVLKEEGPVISEKDAQQIEKLPYVQHVEKVAFMADVHLLMDKEYINSTNDFNEYPSNLRDQIIIPNVNYQIIAPAIFKELYENKSYQDFKGKAIVMIPNKNMFDQEMKNQEISFARKFYGQHGLETKFWNYKVFDVIENPDLTSKEITVLLDKETAMETGIFYGYLELSIFTNDRLTNAQKRELEMLLNEMVSTIPGSL